MNFKSMPPEERTKGAVAMFIIGAALLLFVIRMKRTLVPSAPAPAAATAAAPAATPPTAQATNPAGAGAAVTAKELEVEIPENIGKMKVKDPFALTATYKSRIPNEAGAKQALALKPTSGFSFSKPPRPFNFRSGPSGLPPAMLEQSPLSPIPTMPVVEKGTREMPSPLPSGRISGSAPALPVAEPAPAVKETVAAPEFVVTGTVDGDEPMAILRGKDRNYLVRVGDWLENNLQVHQITARQVALKGRDGRTHILKLGVNANAS